MAAAKQKGTTTDLREALTTVNADQAVITDDVVTGNSNEMTPAAKLLEALGMPTLPTKLSGICDDDSWSCVMREDDDEIGHYVGLLSRIIILFAVVIAVPVILWTITAFVRNQPKVSTFHNLLATASINAPERTTIAEPTQQQSTPRQAKLADRQEAGATERAAPEGPLLVDHPPDAPPSAPSAAQTADTSSALAAISNSATPWVAKGAPGLPPPLAANDGAAAGRTDAVPPMEPAGATEAEADALSASAPPPGPIRLPRPRPHDAGTVRTADTTLSRVPMPRPRPVAGGSGAQQEPVTNNRVR